MCPSNTRGQHESHPNQESYRENLNTSRDYYAAHAAQRHQVSRRQALKTAGIGIAGLAVLGLAGTAWYTHRAVACTVNGKVQTMPIGSSAHDVINRGFAAPADGNLVSVCAAGEVPEVLERGGGNRYTLHVNGMEVDIDTYSANDFPYNPFPKGAMHGPFAGRRRARTQARIICPKDPDDHATGPDGARLSLIG